MRTINTLDNLSRYCEAPSYTNYRHYRQQACALASMVTRYCEAPSYSNYRHSQQLIMVLRSPVIYELSTLLRTYYGIVKPRRMRTIDTLNNLSQYCEAPSYVNYRHSRQLIIVFQSPVIYELSTLSTTGMRAR